MVMSSSSMAQKVESALVAAGYSANNPIPQSVITALCTGIIGEIVANSELIPTSTDTGPAGAGIITGKVA